MRIETVAVRSLEYFHHRRALTLDDMYGRIPENSESVFRGAVQRDGVPVSDILQVWLDVSSHPARGKAQAAEIRKKVLFRFFKKERA